MNGWGLAEWEGAIVIGNGFLTLCVGCFVLYLRAIFVTRKDFGQLDQRVDRQSERLNNGDRRFDRIEERMKSMPTAEALNNLALSMERLNGDVRSAVRQLEGYADLHQTLKHQVDVMDEFLRQSRT